MMRDNSDKSLLPFLDALVCLLGDDRGTSRSCRKSRGSDLYAVLLRVGEYKSNQPPVWASSATQFAFFGKAASISDLICPMPRCPGIQMPNWNFSRTDNPCRVFEETMYIMKRIGIRRRVCLSELSRSNLISRALFPRETDLKKARLSSRGAVEVTNDEVQVVSCYS